MAEDLHDRRDDDLARALAVEPLDEVTRRRIVTRALDDAVAEPETVAAAGGRGRGRFAAVAAAVAFVTLGVLALVLPGGQTAEVAGRSSSQKRSEPTTAAAPAEAAGPADQEPAAASSGTNRTTEAAGATAAPVPTTFGVALGDFGDLSTPAAQRRLFQAIDDAALPPTAEHGSSRIGTTTCPVTGLANLVATATGNVDGHPAVVAVTRRDDGTLRVRLVVTDPCEVREFR